MRILINILITLLLFVLAAILTYFSWQLHWGFGAIVIIIAMIIGLIVASEYYVDDEDEDIKEEVEDEESEVTIEERVELNRLRAKEEAAKQAEADKLQKKENKEKIKLYTLEDGALKTLDSNILLTRIISAIKDVERCEERVVPYVKLTTLTPVIVINDILDNDEVRETVVTFDNADLRDMVFDKLFRDDKNTGGQ